MDASRLRTVKRVVLPSKYQFEAIALVVGFVCLRIRTVVSEQGDQVLLLRRDASKGQRHQLRVPRLASGGRGGVGGHDSVCLSRSSDEKTRSGDGGRGDCQKGKRLPTGAQARKASLDTDRLKRWVDEGCRQVW